MNWIILPYRGETLEMTQRAAEDCLAQTIGDVKLLYIRNGQGPHIGGLPGLHWNFPQPLSLARLWNTALDVVWSTDAPHCLVVNNDVRLRPETYETLAFAAQRDDAWFVSAVGVTPAQFETAGGRDGVSWWGDSRGGPDFSCFLITRECHTRYRFDEGFTPAYCEDLDYHRRLLLDGHGDRIYSINLPFLHYGSGTLKAMDGPRRDALEAEIAAGSRRHYREKWGGDVNQEIYARPFDPTSRGMGVTTPELQRKVQGHGRVV